MKKYLPLLGIVLMVALLAIPVSADVNLGNDLMAEVRTGANIGEAGLGTIVGNVVKVVLSVLGLVALVMFIIAGFQWMTSGGNDDKIKSAQKLMSNAVIGLVIVLIAYAATHFIVQALVDVTEAVE